MVINYNHNGVLTANLPTKGKKYKLHMWFAIASFPGSSPIFVAYSFFRTVCDKKLGRSLGTRLVCCTLGYN